MVDQRLDAQNVEVFEVAVQASQGELVSGSRSSKRIENVVMAHRSDATSMQFDEIAR